MAETPNSSAFNRNVQLLAKLIVTETDGLEKDSPNAPIAVGWTVVNRMKRNGTTHIDQAWHGYRHGKNATATAIATAKGILNGTIPDPSDGATHFYTPNIMPKEGDDTDGCDVSGGLESVPGVVVKGDKIVKPVRNYRPGFAASFTEKAVFGVPPAVFKLYQQPGTGHVH
ncbi:hypothetical protein [Telmatospirillum sp.]|uniref:hypothetical protein n=1 Tax=Telmatospirillum sp. TaxID=2079197 RepID=UPI0028445A1F|nr:hypothetical protein [Telmatospirillum sp.]MDR3435491.1 hypothetical protein [Telmatospirillum sp.]